MSQINHLIQLYLEKIKGISLPGELIRYVVRRNKNKIAFIKDESFIRYEEVFERAKRLANALSSLGFKKGDRVAVLIYNCKEFFEIRIATYLSGIVLVPLATDLKINDIIYILNLCNVKGLIFHPEIIEEDILLIKNQTNIEYLIPLGNECQIDSFVSNSYEDLIRKGNNNELKVILDKDEIASINFSSGTTGIPKAVILTHNNWISSFYNYLRNSNISLGKELRVLHLIPFSLAGSTAILPSIVAGARNIIMKFFDPEKAIHLINRYNINRIFITPGWFIELLQYCSDIGIKPSSLEGITIGTEPLATEKFKEGIEFFGPILEIGYGMVEVLPPLSLLKPSDYIVNNKLQEGRLSSVGKPIKEVSIKVMSHEGYENPYGQIGRIAIRSMTCSKGYLNNHDLTNYHYRGEWFYSEDYGYMDDEGYLYVLGRKSDIIEGFLEKTIFTRQIEEVLHMHPEVKESYVFNDPKKGMVACISLKRNSKNISKDILLNFCEKKLNKNLVPNFLKIYPILPKTSSGKIDRKRIQAEIQ